MVDRWQFIRWFENYWGLTLGDVLDDRLTHVFPPTFLLEWLSYWEDVHQLLVASYGTRQSQRDLSRTLVAYIGVESGILYVCKHCHVSAIWR